jgi:hypothetical protein
MRQQSSKKLSVGSQSKDGKSGATNMKNADDKRKEISTNSNVANTKVGGTKSESGKGGSKNEVSLNFKRQLTPPSDQTSETEKDHSKSSRDDGTTSRGKIYNNKNESFMILLTL